MSDTEGGDRAQDWGCGTEIVPVWRDMSDMDEEPRTPVREKLVGATDETEFVEEFLSLPCPGLKTGEERIKEVDAEEGQSKVLFTAKSTGEEGLNRRSFGGAGGQTMARAAEAGMVAVKLALPVVHREDRRQQNGEGRIVEWWWRSCDIIRWWRWEIAWRFE